MRVLVAAYGEGGLPRGGAASAASRMLFAPQPPPPPQHTHTTARAQARSKVRDAKAQREKDALRAQMDVERRQRELLEEAQEKEKAAAQAAVFETFQALGPQAAAAAAASVPESALAPAPQPKQQQPVVPSAPAAAGAGAGAPARAPAPPPPRASVGGVVDARAIFAAAPAPAAADDGVGTPLPAPRAPLQRAVPVAFTPRAFATPLRESKTREEEDWLARNYGKIREAARAGKAPGSVKYVEKDAAWLKGKAESFAAVGDWDSAASAFGSALAVSPEDAVLHLNRAACHLRKLRGAPAEVDATAALALLLRGWWGGGGDGGGGATAPRCPPELESRALGALAAAAAAEASPAGGGGDGAGVQRARTLAVKALSRRMAARGLCGAFRGALGDCDAATALAGGGGGGALAPARAALAQLADAETVKAAADAAAGSGDAEGALEGYAEALARAPGYVAALLNRAALLLRLHRGAECAADCDAALALLGAAGGAGADALPQATPVPGTELAEQCRVRAQARRDAARALAAEAR